MNCPIVLQQIVTWTVGSFLAGSIMALNLNGQSYPKKLICSGSYSDHHSSSSAPLCEPRRGHHLWDTCIRLYSLATSLHFFFPSMLKLLLPLPAQVRRSAFQKLQQLTLNQHSLAPLSRLAYSITSHKLPSPLLRRSFSSSTIKMSDLSIELTAPNGKKYTQPTGLFINNEWVKSSNEQKITSINPRYANI